MARTKQAARRHKPPPITAEAASIEQLQRMYNAMDIEDDGGVALDDDKEHRALEDADGGDDLAMIRQYYQKPFTAGDEAVYGFILPVTPIYPNVPALKEAGISHLIAVTYHKDCQIILRQWNRDPVD